MNNTPKHLRRALLEGLESRTLFSGVSYLNGTLTLTADGPGVNTIKVALSSDGKSVFAVSNNSARSVLLRRVSHINIVGSDSNDLIVVDPRLKMGVLIESGVGDDTIRGGGGNDTIVAEGGDDLIDGRGGDDQITSGQLSGEPSTATVDPTTTGTTTQTTPTTPVTPTAPVTPVTPVVQTPTIPVVTLPATPVVTLPTTPVANDANAPVAAITRLAGPNMVGMAVHVQGLESVLKSGDALSNSYQWDFGDAGAEYNQLTGWNAAHVYDKAGTYSITLTVTDSAGRAGKTTLNVTIAADSRYAIYVDRNGSDANDGLSAGKSVKTLSRAMQLLGDNTEILLHRGQTWNLDTGVWVASSNVVFDAYGAGDNPVLRWTNPNYGVMFTTDNSANGITFRHLTFDSMRTGDTDSANMVQAIGAGGTNVTVRDSFFLNVGYGINANRVVHGLLAQDNSAPLATGLREYFTWFSGTDGVFLGNVVANSTRQHIVRMTGYDRVLFEHNDFTNLDRRGAGDGSDTAKGTISPHDGAHVYISHNTIHNGVVAFGPLGVDNVNAAMRTDWVVVEDNELFQAKVAANAGAEHARVQGNLMHADGSAAIYVEPFSTDANRGVSDLRIIGNVAINQKASGKFLDIGGAAAGIQLIGNTYYASGFSTVDGDHAAVSINAKTLDALTVVDANTWAITAGGYVPDSFIYAWKGWDGQGLYGAGRWNSQSQVGDDTFIDLRKQAYTLPLASLVGTVGA